MMSLIGGSFSDISFNGGIPPCAKFQVGVHFAIFNFQHVNIYLCQTLQNICKNGLNIGKIWPFLCHLVPTLCHNCIPVKLISQFQ